MALWHIPPFCSFAVPCDVTIIDNPDVTAKRDIVKEHFVYFKQRVMKLNFTLLGHDIISQEY